MEPLSLVGTECVQRKRRAFTLQVEMVYTSNKQDETYCVLEMNLLLEPA